MLNVFKVPNLDLTNLACRAVAEAKAGPTLSILHPPSSILCISKNFPHPIRTPKIILFPGNKKVRFLKIF
jgi:hypothetical protein